MHKLLLDTDVGIDDALMLMHIAAEPNAEIVAIGSTHGNCSSAQAAINTIRVLDVLGLHQVPVAVGNESPIPNAVHSAQVHGADGLGDAGLPPPSRTPTSEGAVNQMIRLSSERPGELDLVAVGTMTNLAAALDRDADVLSRFRSVWILGGISHRPQPHEREMFDANIFNSPAAADKVFAAKGRITVVPIDLSYQVVFSDDHIERIKAADTPAACLAWQILPYYFNFYQQSLGRWTCCVHDPTVSVALLNPSLITETIRRPMIVEPYKNRHHGVGLISGDDGYPTDRSDLTIVTSVDRDRILDRVVEALTTRIGSL